MIIVAFTGSSQSAESCRLARPVIMRHVAKRIEPAKKSARLKRDAALQPEISRVFEANYEVYGARKFWLQLGREGVNAARCTVARLTKDMGLQGVIRGKPMRTTFADNSVPCPSDHVNLQFFAPGPNCLWGNQCKNAQC